jgi:hypothetical protein
MQSNKKRIAARPEPLPPTKFCQKAGPGVFADDGFDQIPAWDGVNEFAV